MRLTYKALTMLAKSALLVALGGPMVTLASPSEPYRAEPMPAGVRVESTELDGPVFADAEGRTLYQWPLKQLRNGVTGDHNGVSECTGTPTQVTAGLMSPYPPGLFLPEVDKHPSCTQMWPPFVAAADAKPIGKWSISERKDGIRQWVYDGLPLYTFFLDRYPGDVLGGRAGKRGLDSPADRYPVGPAPDVPPGVGVVTMSTGQLLVTDKGFSLYWSEHDTPSKSNCQGSCAETWIPVLAPTFGRPRAGWTLIERSPDVKQWAFHKHPLYHYRLDGTAHRFKGSDVPGWHVAYVQPAPSPPPEFTVQDTEAGLVLADSRGRTIYTYFCGDDGVDQLDCDHPTETQVYRLAMCGGGDPERCLQTFPYVTASEHARSTSHSWSIISIDPMTGHRTQPGAHGSLRVWAFRDRPVYTYSGDERPGDINADAHGEFRGERDGFRAFWLRDDFFSADQPGPG